MGAWNWFTRIFIDDNDSDASLTHDTSWRSLGRNFNPAGNPPMFDSQCGGVDVAGNPYGANPRGHDTFGPDDGMESWSGDPPRDDGWSIPSIFDDCGNPTSGFDE